MLARRARRSRPYRSRRHRRRRRASGRGRTPSCAWASSPRAPWRCPSALPVHGVCSLDVARPRGGRRALVGSAHRRVPGRHRRASPRGLLGRLHRPTARRTAGPSVERPADVAAAAPRSCRSSGRAPSLYRDLLGTPVGPTYPSAAALALRSVLVARSAAAPRCCHRPRSTCAGRTRPSRPSASGARDEPPTLRPMRWWDVDAVMPLERALFPADPWSAAGFWSELAGVPATRTTSSPRRTARWSATPGCSRPRTRRTCRPWPSRPTSRARASAAALLEALVDEARRRGATALMLEVRADNEPALALYERHGFDRLALRRGYYGPRRRRGGHAPEAHAVSALDEPLVLGIETSCDETGVGIVRGTHAAGRRRGEQRRRARALRRRRARGRVPRAPRGVRADGRAGAAPTRASGCPTSTRSP